MSPKTVGRILMGVEPVGPGIGRPEDVTGAVSSIPIIIVAQIEIAIITLEGGRSIIVCDIWYVLAGGYFRRGIHAWQIVFVNAVHSKFTIHARLGR